MPPALETDRRHRADPVLLEARLTQLRTMREARVAADRRRRWTIGGALAAIALALGAGATVVDLGAGGMSPRSPVFWLVGLVAIAGLPLLYLALRGPAASADDPDAALDAAGLDLVIAHVERDLVESRLVAPAQSLQIVEPEAEQGGLSVAESGGLTEPER